MELFRIKIRFDTITSPGGSYAELRINNTGSLIVTDVDFFKLEELIQYTSSDTLVLGL